MPPTWLDLQIERDGPGPGAPNGTGRWENPLPPFWPNWPTGPPITAARYKGQVLKTVSDLRSRDYDRLLTAGPQPGRENPKPAEILEGNYPLISPALDFLDDLAVVMVPPDDPVGRQGGTTSPTWSPAIGSWSP
jgi:hypothetical protein